jgi:hypothetical protein
MKLSNENLLWKLCVRDPRHPNYEDLCECMDPDDVRPVGEDCYCNSCFYGTHIMACEILEWRKSF